MLSPAGWTYDAQGRVIRIPQYDPERSIPAEYRTPAYRCVARHGDAWVALEEPIASIPDLPEFGAPGWRTIFQFYEAWSTSPLRVLENSFDNAHFFEKKDVRFLRGELTYGFASRVFTLGFEVDRTKAIAKYVDGVLTLTLPKFVAAHVDALVVQ